MSVPARNFAQLLREVLMTRTVPAIIMLVDGPGALLGPIASPLVLLSDDNRVNAKGFAPKTGSGQSKLVGMSKEYIESCIVEEIRAVVPSGYIGLDTPLETVGIDSIAVLELRNKIEDRLGVRLRNDDLASDSLSIATLTRLVLDKLKDSRPSLDIPAQRLLPTSVWQGTASPIPSQLHKPIVFVLSSPRSGSSLLQLCLQAHPSLYAGQELHLLPFDTMAERAADLTMATLTLGLVQTFAELLGQTVTAARIRLAAYGADCPTWRVYQSLLLQAGSRILVDKSPPNAHHINVMHRARQLFSSARYIHLIRHPYACVSSGLELVRGFMDYEHATWTAVEQSWVGTNRACDTFMRFLEDERKHGHAVPSMRLRYEDLLRDPEGVTQALCRDLLDIGWVAGMADPYTTRAVESFRGTLGEHATADPKLLRRKKIEATHADKWREIRPPQPLLNPTIELAMAYGYELPPQMDFELQWITQPGEQANQPPVLCIHDFTGLLWAFRKLGPLLSDSGCLGIRCSTRLLDGCMCMQDLAARYITIAPLSLWGRSRPICIVAYSLGCHIAFWMASLLEADGYTVELVLLDGPVGLTENLPPRMGGYAKQIALHLRRKAGITHAEAGGADVPNTYTLSEEGSAAMAIAQLEVVLEMLEGAGKEACAAAARLLEMPDVAVMPISPPQCPTLLIHTAAYRERGVRTVATRLLPQSVVHELAGTHFSFITKSALDVADLVADWRAQTMQLSA